MTIPLYQHHNAPPQLPVQANLGLWYSRFYAHYSEDWKINDSGKTDWIKTVTGVAHTQSNKALLQNTHKRLSQLYEAIDAQQSEFTTEWNFVTGLGLSHPVENGFTWHHTLGCPYLPASSVKGLLRAWVEVWMEEADLQKIGATNRATLVQHWFGNAKTKDKQSDASLEEAAGSLVFFDAIPKSPPVLTADVMTPHMGKWYEEGGNIKSESDYASTAPADWHNPVPVPFLVVQNATFLFAIAPRKTEDAVTNARNQQNCKHAMEQLSEALQWMGAGAKTAAGYGRMYSQEQRRIKSIRDSRQTVASGIVWEKAKVEWNKSNKEFNIYKKNGTKDEKALMKMPESIDFFNKLDSAIQNKLNKGKDVNANVTVDINSKHFSITEINFPPA